MPLWLEKEVRDFRLSYKVKKGCKPRLKEGTPLLGWKDTKAATKFFERKRRAIGNWLSAAGQPEAQQRLGKELLQIQTHDMRKSRLNHLYREGMKMEVLQAWVGHSAVEITRKYIEISHEELQDGDNVLQRAAQRPAAAEKKNKKKAEEK